MGGYRFVLFLHLFFVIVAFSAAAITHMSMFELRKAKTIGEVRPISRRMAAMEPLFPLSALLLFLAGAYLVHDAWEWSDAWIVTSIVALIVMEVIGGTVLRNAGHKLAAAVESGDATSPVPAVVSQLQCSPTLWIASHVPTALALAIVYMMSVKPGVGGSLLTVAVFLALGVASAVPFASPVKLGTPERSTQQDVGTA